VVVKMAVRNEEKLKMEGAILDTVVVPSLPRLPRKGKEGHKRKETTRASWFQRANRSAWRWLRLGPSSPVAVLNSSTPPPKQVGRSFLPSQPGHDEHVCFAVYEAFFTALLPSLGGCALQRSSVLRDDNSPSLSV
jgi:hypothetical protein